MCLPSLESSITKQMSNTLPKTNCHTDIINCDKLLFPKLKIRLRSYCLLKIAFPEGTDFNNRCCSDTEVNKMKPTLVKHIDKRPLQKCEDTEDVLFNSGSL